MPDPKRGHFSRSRSLAKMDKKFGKGVIESTIRKYIARGGPVRVLEIGCGEGRVLMELRKLFPNIELHGINKKPWPAMKGTESLKKTAVFYKIFKPGELKGVNLPKIHFYDAKKLRFKDDYFDLVISQVSIQYVKRKDRLLEEVWRVLKKGGAAFLNIDVRREDGPDFLDGDTPRFVIYDKGRRLEFNSLVGRLRKQGYDISFVSKTVKENMIRKNRRNLILKKNTDKPLKLHLKFDELSSFDLNRFNDDKDLWDYYWGYRSVYRL